MSKNKIATIPDLERFKAIGIYVTLSTIVFVAIYGWCNLQASQSSVHYAMFTDWETTIPLVPWMIYFYVSLNVLLVVAAFVLKEASAVKAFCLSLIVSTFIAGIVFYLFPGKLGFVREGAVGYEKYFEFMFSIDHPHNLFPSLHVTYSAMAILAMIEQTLNKVFHVFLWVWLLLISSSVIFVHQHHLIDVVTGFLLALFVNKFVYLKLHKTKYV
jgi:membrane-associated phospholipid phosphatase